MVFIADDMPELWSSYTEEGIYVYCASNIHEDLALLNNVENVVIVGAFMSLAEFCEAFQSQLVPLVEATRAKKTLAKSKAAPVLPTNLVKTTGRYRVLIIDDKPENLELARLLLAEHELVTADGLKSGMAEMAKGKFDAVLTDMEMKPDNFYPSFSVTSQPLGQTVLFGWAVAAEVTKRGVPVAIVTDGNHHTSWTVAMFNSMKRMEMNGQTVLLFGNIGKRWNEALKALMEPEKSSMS